MSGRAKPYLKQCANFGCHVSARTGLISILVMTGLMSAGCSINMPVFGWSSFEDEPAAARVTSSISAPMRLMARVNETAPGFSSELGVEDLRRANGALALALDPQGNGSNVSWDNPQSGMKGQILPLGSPFLKSDEICRDFMASTALQAGQINQKGTACRLSGGDWTIKTMEIMKKS